MPLFGRSREPGEAAHTRDGDAESILLDKTSGLYALWYFRHRLGEEVARCSRYGRPLALVVCELNLLPGESVADETIQRVGEVIRSGIRQTDLATCLDRSNFAALLVEARPTVAATIAHRLKSELTLRVRSHRGPWKSGTAAFPDDGVDAEAILQVAQRRLREDVSAAS